MPAALTELLYLLAAVLFVLGLKRLGSPGTAVAGNRLSAVGMLIAVVVTLFDRAILSYGVIVAGLVVGSALGLWMARTVRMTAMPQMVALLNGFGGGASLLVGGAVILLNAQPIQARILADVGDGDFAAEVSACGRCSSRRIFAIRGGGFA